MKDPRKPPATDMGLKPTTRSPFCRAVVQFAVAWTDESVPLGIEYPEKQLFVAVAMFVNAPAVPVHALIVPEALTRAGARE
jgi:hypothetical protein